MSKSVYGSQSGTTLQLYPGYPRMVRSGAAWEVTFRYWCLQSAAYGLVPANGATCPITGFSGHKLREATINPNSAAGMADVELTYRTDANNIGVGGHAAGDVTREAALSTEELSIDDPRLVSSSILTQAQVDALKTAGAKSFPVGSVEYTYTEYVASFVWQQSNIIAACGTVQNPTGMTSPSAGHWMSQGARIRQVNDGLTEVSTTWRYNEAGWL